jgi:osmotically-inducible protein OsmY
MKTLLWLALFTSLSGMGVVRVHAFDLRTKLVAQQSDDFIADKVRIRLAGDPQVKGAAIDVRVSLGIVTLRGRVESAAIRSRAEKITRKVKGVKHVVNNLEVRAA